MLTSSELEKVPYFPNDRISTWLNATDDPWTPLSSLRSHKQFTKSRRESFCQELEDIKASLGVTGIRQQIGQMESQKSGRVTRANPRKQEDFATVYEETQELLERQNLEHGAIPSSFKSSTEGGKAPRSREALTPGSATSFQPPVVKATNYSPPKSLSHESSKTRDSRKRGNQLRMRDLQMAKDRFIFATFPKAYTTFPDNLKSLYDSIKDLSDGLGILPAYFRECNEAEFESMSIADHEIRRHHFFYDMRVEEPHRPPLSIESVRDIMDETDICMTRNAPEAHWNTAVHGPILKAAVKGFAEMGWANISSATIQPASLLPFVTTETSSSRKVDFALTLQSPAIYQKIRQLQIRDINQTMHEFIAKEPITLNVETKTSGVGSETALFQLGIWTFAQFEKLHELFESMPDFLPALIVDGEKWSFAVVLRTSDIDDTGSSSVTSVISGLDIGRTNTESGVWKIMAVLNRLIRWSLDDYAPWINSRLDTLLKPIEE